MERWAEWIGRSETRQDKLTWAILERLNCTLDLPLASVDQVSPLAHWLCFLPDPPQSMLDEDGHPRRSGFLPPIDLPRRMWAGGRLTFHAPLPLDTELVRHSTIVDVTEKWGSSGRLAFVTIRHEITVDGIAITTEEQDLVYREAAGQTPAPPAESPPSELCDAEHVVFPDSRLLFRFSALTFNAHRIHYDRPYACEVEGYGGLVVHGPLVATFLLHHGLAGTGFSKPAQFSFRARRPLIDGASIHFCRVVEGETTRLWARDAVGHVGMTAMLR